MSLYPAENVYSAYVLGLFPQENKTSESLDHILVRGLMSHTVVRSSLAYLSFFLFAVAQILCFNCE